MLFCSKMHPKSASTGAKPFLPLPVRHILKNEYQPWPRPHIQAILKLLPEVDFGSLFYQCWINVCNATVFLLLLNEKHTAS